MKTRTKACHEFEIFGGGPEAAESELRWRKCTKNPGHKDFISAKDFKDNYLPRVHTNKLCGRLGAAIDLTVRLRVSWTSPQRSDEDSLSNLRGSNAIRMGTGFIHNVKGTVSNEPCPGNPCDGEIIRKVWRFEVRTAQHVVYNTEEAKTTRVDLFYDDDSCKLDGMIKTVSGLKAIPYHPDRDICDILCETHDEALVERIKSARRCWLDEEGKCLDLSGLDLLPPYERGRDPTLIVSHPHGQPKKITVGFGKVENFPVVVYNAATCPGSSGAPVFWFDTHPEVWGLLRWVTPVHSGVCTTTFTQHQAQLNLFTRFLEKLRGRKSELDQLNYGNDWWRLLKTLGTY